MLFAGQVYEVEMACLFFFDWGAPLGARGCLLGSCSDDRPLQEELCFKRRAEKMKPSIRLPLPLCGRNDSITMNHIACIYSDVDVGQEEFIHNT